MSVTPYTRRALLAMSIALISAAPWAQAAVSEWRPSLTAEDTYAIAVDPTNPQTVYVGGDRIFKSTDGGQSWRTVYRPKRVPCTGCPHGIPRYVETIVIDPQSPRTIYAGTGDINGGGDVLKSTNDGRSWRV